MLDVLYRSRVFGGSQYGEITGNGQLKILDQSAPVIIPVNTAD